MKGPRLGVSASSACVCVRVCMCVVQMDGKWQGELLGSNQRQVSGDWSAPIGLPIGRGCGVGRVCLGAPEKVLYDKVYSLSVHQH